MTVRSNPEPVRSWDRKLDRAEEHIEALAKAIEAFVGTDPYAVDRRLDAEGADHVYFFSRFTDPPDSIALLVGDAVHNLRASLDHIVFSLAQEGAKAAGISMTKRAETSIQFPIAVSPENFDDQVGSHRLRFVAPEAKAVIERLQPYWLSPGQPERSWIAGINSLDITDKHRTIPALGTVVSYYAFTAPAGEDQPQVIPRMVAGEWGVSAEIVRYRFSEPKPDVNLEFNPTFTVTIDSPWPESRPADVILRRYAQYIRDYVTDPFARFF